MPRILLLVSICLVATAGAVNCTTGTTDGGTESATPTATLPIFTPQPQWSGELHGRVVDPDGTPLPGLVLTFCGQVCLFATSENDGTFSYTGVRPMTAVLETSSYPDDDASHWSRWFDFVTLGEDEVINLTEDLVVPYVESPNTIPNLPADLTLDGGLQVHLPADTEDPEGRAQLAVGAVELPAEQWPRNGLDGWTIQRAWALTVWDVESKEGFDITAPLTQALGAGTDTALLYADYEDGIFSGQFEMVAGTLAGDGLSISGSGIERLTLLLAVSR